MELTSFYITFAALFGAIVGSFLNVVILRLPKENASIVYPASHCPKCENALSWYENIPILSYLFQFGKCRHCKGQISWQYPVVELVTALLTAALVHKFGLTMIAAGYVLFMFMLMVITVIDIHHQIIPDIMSLSGIALGFLFSFVNTHVYWQDSLVGLLAGYSFYFVVVLYFIIRKKAGMGGGDIKLLSMLGAFLGWQSLLFILFCSSITGVIVGSLVFWFQKKDSSSQIPFGPFLAFAGLLFLFYSERILVFMKL